MRPLRAWARSSQMQLHGLKSFFSFAFQLFWQAPPEHGPVCEWVWPQENESILVFVFRWCSGIALLDSAAADLDSYLSWTPQIIYTRTPVYPFCIYIKKKKRQQKEKKNKWKQMHSRPANKYWLHLYVHYTPVANGSVERRRIHLRITRLLKFMWFCCFAFAAWACRRYAKDGMGQKAGPIAMHTLEILR